MPEIRSVTRYALGTRGFSGADILESWTDIVGADLSKGVRPEKLVFEKNNRSHGTLVVKTAGGAFAMLFEHQKRRVMERINAFFGYPAVSDIKMIQGALKLSAPAPVKSKKVIASAKLNELSDKVAAIEDMDLRAATYEIGKALLEKQN
ncbi:MAG: DUF721 domain-containing protein [Alphaproteobacteria bacterium]